MSEDEAKKIALLEKSLARYQKRLEKAEELLETKSRELYSANQEAERRATYVEKILKSIHDFIFITDEKGLIIKSNIAVLKYFQIIEEDLNKVNIDDIFTIESNDEYLEDQGQNESDFNILKASKSPLNERMLKIGSISVLTSVACSRIWDENNELAGVIVSARNTEKNRELFDQLRKTQSHLRSANEKLKAQQSQLISQEKMASLGQMSAGIAHEINNPMGYINSNVKILEDYLDEIKEVFYTIVQKTCAESDPSIESIVEYLNDNKMDETLEDSKELLKETEEGAERVLGIVQGLKQFSHMDDQDGKKQFDLNKEILTTLRIINNEIKYKATVETHFEELPDLNGNPGQLNQVFLNIIVNAAHAIEQEGVIVIRTWRSEDAVYISIKDNGLGIDEKNLNKLFDPFFTTKEVGKGTGLGLSISKGIIDAHEGSIEVKSELGEGTEFVISLPL